MAGTGGAGGKPSLVEGFQLSVRGALGAGLSLMIARALDLPFPIYAMIAAVIVTDLSPAKTRRLAIPRVLGSLLGASIGALLSPWGAHAWLIVPGIFGAMFACHALGLKDAARLAGYVCGIVMLDHAADPWMYAFYRVAETFIGGAVAVALSFVPTMLRPHGPPR
jgi:uncharacterized membrane protein YgaE (UPF0421/DUF939 family)